MNKFTKTEAREKLSVYVLPGRVRDPTRAVPEAQDAMAAGIGGVWVSERYASKEPAVICGALAAGAPGLRIGGTFYAHMRHPIVTASIANVMQALCGNKFTVVLARAIPAMFEGFNVPQLTFPRLADTIGIMRKLWAGEAVDYNGVLGSFSNLRLTDLHLGPPPPIVFTAVGPKALAFAGTHCDGALLHPLLTTQAVANAAKIVRSSAERSGRGPTAVRIIANVIAAPDLHPDREDEVVGGRAVTYLQSPLGPLLAESNGWDIKELAKLRAHPSIAHLDGKIASQSMNRLELVEASRSLPRVWLESGTAIGTATHCATRLVEYFDAGADEVLLHGSAPDDLARTIKALTKGD